jgi:3-phenylpropionate/cinnamic acid dioxygenase small subunit
MISNDVHLVEQLLLREAALLDKRQWDDWLALMTPDVEFWIPAWHSEDELTSDPAAELSLIYYDSRIGLEDRVFRLRSGRSVASTPWPRTCHFVTNITARQLDDGHCEAFANWQVLSYRLEQTTQFFGHYQYLLAHSESGAWRIRKKKIVVLNDVIPTVLDFNLV